ncbi:MAG: DinB family protein [Asgard group archaeon]|nr:DinB family protein [Asgard group archaeon]
MRIRMKDSLFVKICKNEYHALIQMLQKEIKLCTEELWNKEIDEPPFWQQVYHTIYYLDFYLGDNPKKRPERFTVRENLNEKMDEILTKKELLDYLASVKEKCDQVLKELTMEKLEEKNSYFWTGPTLAHRLIYNIRHSQHHIGRLNSILRRHMGDVSKWIITSKD